MAINEGKHSSGSSSSTWTWQQNKAFEIGLAIFPEDSEDRWENIAAQIPGNKTLEEIKHHYQLLVDDLNLIESGRIPLPNYDRRPSSLTHLKGKTFENQDSEWETRKGQPWTEEEHKQFLLGMDKYGKGDWKSIAKEFVKTRTATQVASHAQKHFKRQAKKKEKDGKRWSIFDITTPKDKRGERNDNVGDREGKEKKPSNVDDDGKGKERVREEEDGGLNNKQVSDDDEEDLELLSPPDSLCVEDNFDLELDLDLDLDLDLKECLSQLPPL